MEFYEITHKGLHSKVLKAFKDVIPSPEKYSWNILDIGCWNWHFLHELLLLWYKNLNWCDWFLENKKIEEFANFKQCNLNEELPYKDASFDCVILTEVIEHLEYPNLLLNEIHRILKPNWILILSTPNIFSLVSRLLFLFNWELLSFRKCDSKFTSFPGHISPFFPHIFSEIFKNKFKIKKKNYSNFIIPFFGIKTPIHNRLFSICVILTIEKI